MIVKRLARPDAADLLTPPPAGVDAAALAREATALRTKLTEALALWQEDVLTAVEYRTTRTRLERRLVDVEARQHTASARDPLAGIAGNPDAADVWERLDLGRQRAILNALLVVTVLPAPRGRLPDGSRFDPDAIDIKPARRTP